MRFLDFTTVAPREVAPGYLGRYLHSDHITQGRVDIAPGAVIPDHSHPHQQWTLLLSGSFELTVSGVTHVLRPGQVLYIAPHERHSARALTACAVPMCSIRPGTPIADPSRVFGVGLYLWAPRRELPAAPSLTSRSPESPSENWSPKP